MNRIAVATGQDKTRLNAFADFSAKKYATNFLGDQFRDDGSYHSEALRAQQLKVRNTEIVID